MLATSQSDAAFEMLSEREAELLDSIVNQYRQGTPLKWPTVSPSLISGVWEHYTRTGLVVDDGRFEQIVAGMRDCVLLLRICTILAGHESYSAESYYGLEEDADAMWEWIAATAPSEPISDYGMRPLEDALFAALSTPSNRMGEKLKHVDRMLHIAHRRGDLSALLVTGGRKSVLHLPEVDEQDDGQIDARRCRPAG